MALLVDDKILLDAGYKQFKHPMYSGEVYGRFYIFSFQKAIKNKEGLKKYFININKFDFRPMGMAIRWGGLEVRMYVENDEFDLNCLVTSDMSIEQLEAFYEKAYDVLGCVPDKHNN